VVAHRHKTQTFPIPYRPSADATNCGWGRGSGTTAQLLQRQTVNITFTSPVGRCRRDLGVVQHRQLRLHTSAGAAP
jgi:hypothetical protein